MAPFQSDQYESDETTSPPLSVISDRWMTMFRLSLRNRTEPSPKRTLTPPGWNPQISSSAPALMPWEAPDVGYWLILVARCGLVIDRHRRHDSTIGLGPAPESSEARRDRTRHRQHGRNIVSLNSLMNRASRPASSTTAMVWLKPSVASAMRVLPCLSRPSVRRVQFR